MENPKSCIDSFAVPFLCLELFSRSIEALTLGHFGVELLEFFVAGLEMPVAVLVVASSDTGVVAAEHSSLKSVAEGHPIHVSFSHTRR